jgi:hypothetical protein
MIQAVAQDRIMGRMLSSIRHFFGNGISLPIGKFLLDTGG